MQKIHAIDTINSISEVPSFKSFVPAKGKGMENI